MKLRPLRILPYLVVLALICTLIFYPKETKKGSAEKRVVTVWCVDTFEGGKGSRCAFLGKVARRAEKKSDGAYYFFTAYSPEGAEEAFSRGDAPDLIAFGMGLDCFAERCRPLPYSSASGSVGGKCLAVPWCRGRYYLFSHGETDKGGETAISCGGSNLPAVAAYFGGVGGSELPAEQAYVEFLSGKYAYLLGTQRDVYRFQARGKTVERKELADFCDLYCFVSLLNEEAREDGIRFLEELLSPETQSELGQIGMEAPVESGKTLPLFTSQTARETLAAYARQGDEKNMEKFLKTI